MTYPPELHAEIRRLHYAEHWPVGTVASQLHVHPDVVRRAVGLIDRKQPKPRKLLLSPYQSFIESALKAYPTLRATRLMGMLVERGYKGSISTLRTHVRQVRPTPEAKPALRIETLPAEQAQVDWAFVGHVTIHGTQRKLWLFLIVLSYSRAMWGEFVLDLGAASLQRSMVRAMKFFKGSPRKWLFDNAKSIAVARHGKAVRFHADLMELADAYRVKLQVCAVRRPEHKGKVERLVRYVREAFLVGREIGSVRQGNRELLEFICGTANVRPHPVRNDETVAQALEHEQQLLLPLPDVEPPTDQLVACKVSRDGFVRFETNAYSVPPELVGATVTLAVSDTRLRVIQGDTCRAEHSRCWGKRCRMELREHRAALVAQRRGAKPARGQDRLRAVAPAIERIFERWVQEGRNIGSQTAKVVKLLDLYGDKLFAAAVDIVDQRGTHDVGALAVACERLRRDAHRPVPVELHRDDLPERDVIPHSMEAYDRVADDQE
jgi:transposase